MVRGATDRINKYSRKISGDIHKQRYDATKDLAVKQEKKYFAEAVALENKVKIIVDGQPSISHHFYIAFAEELVKKTTVNEREIVYQKWKSRGLDGPTLEEIGAALIGWTKKPVATSEGPNNPGTMADDDAIGTLIWANPDNAKVSDGIYTIVAYVGASTVIIDNEIKVVKSDGSIGTENKAVGDVWDGVEDYYLSGSSNDLWGEVWTAADINNANFGVVLSVREVPPDEVSHYLKATNFGFTIPEGATINGILVEIERVRTESRFIAYGNVDHIRITVYYTH